MPPRILKVDAARPEPEAIAEAAAVLGAGGLVAFPTETVYGLGADALSEVAVRRVYAVKGRPFDDPIIVHVLAAGDLGLVSRDVPRVAVEMARAFWPGPLTLVVPRADAVPAIVAAGLDSVAVRSPSHPVAMALLRAFGRPIAAPSANPFGRTSPTTAEHVVADLGDRVDLVIDGGACPVGVESTVVDCRTVPPRLLRPGGVPLEALWAWSVAPAHGEGGSGRPVSPGLLARHYAPRARLVVVRADDGAASIPAVLAAAATCIAAPERVVGLLVASEDVALLGPLPADVIVRPLGPLTEDAMLARGLFAALRELDAAGADVVLARDFGAGGLALAIRDRLVRAAEGRVVRLGRESGAAVDEAVRLAVGEGD